MIRGKSGQLLIEKGAVGGTVLHNERINMQIPMKMKMFRLRSVSHTLIATLAALASLTLLADDKEKLGKDKETSFLKQAGQGNLLEVKLGQLASQKSQNSSVKEFADRLVKDHGKANEHLKDVAEKHQITVPTSLDAKHQKKIEDLETKSGSEFDKEFARMMIKSHKKGVSKYQAAAEECEDADLKSYAQRTLPTLKEHFRMAQDLGRSVGLDADAIAAAIREGEEAAGAASSESEVGAGKKESDDK